MFRIRRIYDDIVPANKDAIKQVQKILEEQIPGLTQEDLLKLSDQLRDPIKHKFRSILFVAENSRGTIQGFALLQHAPDLNFCFLDYISSAKGGTGRGTGGALFDVVRQEAKSLGAVGLFLECLPDAPELCPDPIKRKQNVARLRFYERFGARPIIDTAYETPVSGKDDMPPYLVYDNLGGKSMLDGARARVIVPAILRRTYGDLCPSDYIKKVADSFKDGPVSLRPPKYIRAEIAPPQPTVKRIDMLIALVVNDRHDIHHVRDRGYVEAPVRVSAILKELLPTNLFEKVPVRRFPDKHIKAVHDPGFVNYLKNVCANVPPNKSVYPYVFPIRNAARPPKDLPTRAGYYCIDTFTPLNQSAYLAARRAVDCALTGAEHILEGQRIAYALVRPPGHHAEHRAFGGFCYFNSAAVAAHYLSRFGKVTILDIDYHHGNGQQDIFYERSDIQTISLHGHPRFAYPYFSGFADETGSGKGRGFNTNYALPEHLDGAGYCKALGSALQKLAKFRPQFIVLPLGLDTAKGDPTGTWSLTARDFEVNGEMIASLNLPLLVIQEGGYRVRSLGANARHFFSGLRNGRA